MHYEFDALQKQIPDVSWQLSKRSLEVGQNIEELGFFATSSVMIKEGKHSSEFQTDVCIDTVYHQHTVRCILRMNGHQTSASLANDKQSMLLKHVATLCKLPTLQTDTAQLTLNT
jgi:hypothetical protein